MIAVHPPATALPVGLPGREKQAIARRTHKRLSDALGHEDIPAERLAFAATAHWARYLPQSFICVLLAFAGSLIAILGAIVISSFPAVAAVAYVLGTAILLFAYHKLFHMILSERLRSIVITNKRVVYLYSQLFFAENEYEIPLRRITDVSVQKVGIVRNLLDYGTLCFEAPGGEGAIRRCIPYVPRPEFVAERIAALLPPATAF